MAHGLLNDLAKEARPVLGRAGPALCLPRADDGLQLGPAREQAAVLVFEVVVERPRAPPESTAAPLFDIVERVVPAVGVLLLLHRAPLRRRRAPEQRERRRCSLDAVIACLSEAVVVARRPGVRPRRPKLRVAGLLRDRQLLLVPALRLALQPRVAVGAPPVAEVLRVAPRAASLLDVLPSGAGIACRVCC